MDKTCRHCGGQVSQSGAIFCPYCNKALIELPPPAPPPPEEPIPPSRSTATLEGSRPRARRVALVASVVIAFVIACVAFDPRIETKGAKILGPEPLGMTPRSFLLLSLAILFMPFPWVFYHVSLISTQARRDGLRFVGLGGLLYLFEVDRYHPDLRPSKLICLGAILYFFVICTAWIIYAGAHGI
jgi:hypothetical protein